MLLAAEHEGQTFQDNIQENVQAERHAAVRRDINRKCGGGPFRIFASQNLPSPIQFQSHWRRTPLKADGLGRK
jgi:hypothetical protein